MRVREGGCRGSETGGTQGHREGNREGLWDCPHRMDSAQIWLYHLNLKERAAWESVLTAPPHPPIAAGLALAWTWGLQTTVPRPVFVNQVLLEHRHMHSYTYCLHHT